MEKEYRDDNSFGSKHKITCIVDESSFEIGEMGKIKCEDELELSYTQKNGMCLQAFRTQPCKKYIWGEVIGFRTITIGEYYELITFVVEESEEEMKKRNENKKEECERARWNVDIINQTKRPDNNSIDVRLRQIFTFTALHHPISHSSGTGGGYAKEA